MHGPTMKILLGVGGSELSYQALTETLERVSETGDELTVAVFENGDIDADLETVQQRIQEYIDESGSSRRSATSKAPRRAASW